MHPNKAEGWYQVPGGDEVKVVAVSGMWVDRRGPSWGPAKGQKSVAVTWSRGSKTVYHTTATTGIAAFAKNLETGPVRVDIQYGKNLRDIGHGTVNPSEWKRTPEKDDPTRSKIRSISDGQETVQPRPISRRFFMCFGIFSLDAWRGFFKSLRHGI